MYFDMEVHAQIIFMQVVIFKKHVNCKYFNQRKPEMKSCVLSTFLVVRD